MHVHEKSAPVSVRVQVVTVSTSRGAAEDVSGPLLRELLVSAGHAVVGPALVPDDPERIGAVLDAALAGEVDAVVLTGGTGVSARDCTPRVVEARLDRVLPGFGELFRMLSYAEVGAKAMLSTAVGGVAAGRLVYALPGSPAACRLAMEKLVLPTLGHLVAELRKEAPLPPRPSAAASPARAAPTRAPAPAPAAADTAPQGVQVVPTPAAERPPEEDLPTGWRAALRALGGALDRTAAVVLPERVERLAPAMDVLSAAGDRATVRLPDGRVYAAFGYPDLVRNGSKVLLVREGEPFAEVVALHRWPRAVGICVDGEEGLVPSAELDPGPVAEERVGVPYTGPGQLFAVEGGSVHLLDGRRVLRFDGRGAGEALPLATAVGSLLLQWSQR